jgi:hypothetical protein
MVCKTGAGVRVDPGQKWCLTCGSGFCGQSSDDGDCETCAQWWVDNPLIVPRIEKLRITLQKFKLNWIANKI